MIPVLITWGFNTRTGKIELDCYLELDDPKHASAVKMVYLRKDMNNHEASLLRLPEGAEREDVESWLKTEKLDKVIEKLNKAKVKQQDIVRKKHEGGNTMDFIMGG